MIEARVSKVVYYERDLLVLLQAEGDPRILPIGIDASQAHSIELQLEGIAFPRPLTHDLMKMTLDRLDCRLVRAEINDLVDRTFIASLHLTTGGREIEIDARPSDAIALALRCEAPILVAEAVMDKAGVVIELEKPAADFGVESLQKKLKSAIAEERYEDAAKLRDAIKRKNVTGATS